MTLLRFCDCKGNKTFLFVKIFIELFFCGSWERFQIRSGVSVCLSLTAPPRGASGECGYCVTAWRTTCLYGVTYSRASPRLFEDAILLAFIYKTHQFLPIEGLAPSMGSSNDSPSAFIKSTHSGWSSSAPSRRYFTAKL